MDRNVAGIAQPPPPPRQRVLLVKEDPPTPTPPGEISTFTAAFVEGMLGDRVVLYIPGHGVYEFDREQGEFLSGPDLNFVDARILPVDFDTKVSPRAYPEPASATTGRVLR